MTLTLEALTQPRGAMREALQQAYRKGADLFAGCGGTTQGAKQAAARLHTTIEVTALNHWDIAIGSHQRNNPTDRHLWADIEGINPIEVIPEGRLDFLVASPECVFFSKARGGKPINDQRRSTAGYVLRWLRQLDIGEVMLENVQEFEQWGPIYPDDYPIEKLQGRPIPEHAGECFRRFVHQVKKCGYRHVEWRILRSADYGDPTTRERFFLRASKTRPIVWPAPTHSKEQWVPAREIIDWSNRGTSIYGRKPRLAQNTMKRILTGFNRYSGLQPFLVNIAHGKGDIRTYSPEQTLPTVTGKGTVGVVQASPFLVSYHGDRPGQNDGRNRGQSLELPLSTVDTSNRFAKVEPCLVVLRNHADTQSIDATIPALCAEGQHFGVANFSPWMVNNKGKSDACDVDVPTPTITAHAQHLAVGEPYLIQFNEGTERRVSDLNAPLPTVMAGATRFSVGQSYLTKYYGSSADGQPVDEALDTVTTKGRFGLAQPALFAEQTSHLLTALDDPDALYRPPVVQIGGALYIVDILYRMLTPRELANAHSFPADYYLGGTQADQVRQVGNAVTVKLAEALCYEMLKGMNDAPPAIPLFLPLCRLPA